MNKELVDYIKQQTNINVSRNKITDVLLKQGWHQSEIDEAFVSADDGVGRPIEAKRADFDDGKFDDSEQDKSKTLFGLSRNIIFIAAAALVVLAIIAGVIIFPSLGAKNSGSANTAPVANTNTTVNNTAAVSNQDSSAGQAKVAAVDLAVINGLKTSLQPPAGWIVREGTIRTRPMAVFFKPTTEKDSAGKDVFNENISVTGESIKSVNVADAAAYLAKSKTVLQSTVEGYKIDSERKVKLADGTEVTLINGSFTQSGLDLKNTQMFAFNGDNAYIITGVALAANWDQEKDMIGMAMMTFKFPSLQ